MEYGMEQGYRQASKMNDYPDTADVPEEFDCSAELQLDKGKQHNVRQLLRRYKSGTGTEREKQILAEAMSHYQLLAEDDTDRRAFNVLLLSYFSVPTLTAFQISELLHIDKRTVFKDISKGVSDLCVLIYGIDAFSAHEPEKQEELDRLCECIKQAIREEVRRKWE